MCGGTYRNEWLTCTQNRESENILLADGCQSERSEKVLSTKCFMTSKNEKKLNSDYDEFELPAGADILAVWVNYFTRNVDKPVRFRHSTGSPSLLLGMHQKCSFGDEEVDQFFKTYSPCDNVTSKKVVPTKTEIDKSSVNLFLKDVGIVSMS